MWTSKPSEEVKFANSIDPSSLLKFSREVGCLRIESAFYPWYAVFSLHFTLSLHFTPGLQSAFHTFVFFLAAVLLTGKRVALSSRLQSNYLLKNSVKSLRFCGKWSNLIPTTVALFTNASTNRVDVEIQWRKRNAGRTLSSSYFYAKNHS